MTPRTIAVKGGIGDFLQCLPFMLDNPQHDYVVVSHQACVSDFFKAVGIHVEERSLGQVNGMSSCPRSRYFERNPFPKRRRISADGRPIIGVHLGGSDYSLGVEKRFGFPPKNLPLSMLYWLIVDDDDKYDFLLFGQEYQNLKPTPKLAALKTDDIAVQLSFVEQCSAFIGSDSAFKTMSAMLRIPTVVWCGDYTDHARDDTFIDPYTTAGVMYGFRYNAMTSEEIFAGVKASLEFINARI